MNDTLKYARDYVEKGFSVIPLKPKSKEPALTSWKEYQDKLPTDAELISWFDNDSGYNIGIIAGKISKLAIIDCDTQEAIQYIIKHGLDQAPTVETSKGRHYYFKSSGVKSEKYTDGNIKIDLKAEGGYVVAPPSIHETGKIYQWMPGKEVDTLPLPQFTKIPWTDTKNNKKDKTVESKSVKDLYNGSPDGTRHNDLIKLLGSWIHGGLSENQCLENAQIWNTKNKPPLTNEELASQVKDAYSRYHKKDICQQDEILELTKGMVLFHDQYQDAYIHDGEKMLSLSGDGISQILTAKYYEKTKIIPSPNPISHVVNLLKSQAIHKGPEIELHNRVAMINGEIWYDISNGRAVRINKSGWTIEKSPIIFRKYSHQRANVTPVTCGDPWKFFEQSNVSRDYQLLLLVYIISTFIPEIPHPIFYPYGTQGAAKSTLCKMIKKLCDPSTDDIAIAPAKRKEMIQVLSHHHICIFDNLSVLPGWMSDILAKACTGATLTKRRLYSNDDDVSIKIKNCGGMNGINQLITKPDLMDRTLLIQLERIPDKDRKLESEIWSNFNKNLPDILGGIFDVLSIAMEHYPYIQLTALPRMADFVKWGVAITKALGREDYEFLKAYENNIEKQNDAIIEGNALVQAVMSMMETTPEWRCKMSEAYNELLSVSGESIKNDPTFPKHTNKLQKHLKIVEVNLLARGISYKIEKPGASGTYITFRKSE
jgi:hypothetical protein